ncbi:hypothetical protein KR059_011856, partial [Drosophila kikkawai]
RITCRLLQFTLPNVRTIFILMIVVVAFAMQTCAEKKGYVLTLKDHSNRAMHINSHGKVSAEDISLAQFFTMDSVGDVMDFMDFRITIYAGDVNYFLCFHQGRLVGKRNATKDCHFRESMVNGHHQYTHAYNPVLHVGFKHNFRPVGPKDLAKPHVMKKATFFFFSLDEEKFRRLLRHLKNHTEKTKTIKTTRTTSTTSTTTTTTKPPSTTTKTPTTTPTPITTTTLSPVAGTKRTRSKSRRPTSINSDSIPSESRSPSNSLKSYNQANSNNDEDEDLLQQQKILQRNRKQHRLKKQQQQERRHKHRQQGSRRTVGLMAQPQPKNLEVRHHHKNATIMERRRRRRLERQQHKLQRELWEREQQEHEREEHHLPKAATSSASSSSSSSSSTATSTALTATAASLAPSAFNLVAIVAASRRKRDRRKRSAAVASSSKSGGASQPPPAADMQLVELPSQRQQPQNTEYSKPYVNSNLNNPLNSSNSINVNHAIPALPKNYNYLYSNEHYNLNTKSSTTDSSSLETSTKFDSPNSHSHSHSNSNSNSHSDSHSHSAFNQNIDNNLKQLNDRIEEVPEAGEREMKVEMEMKMQMKLQETASEDAVVENRNHIDANNIIDDTNDEEHEELILNKLFRGLQELQQQQQQQQQQQPNIDNHNENINVVNNNQNHNDNGLLTNNNHNSNYNEQFANDDETIRIQNNKYETHIVQYKHVVFISK